MAANDYYYGQQQQPPYANSASPAPYYSPQQAPSPQSTPAPSYHTGYAPPAPSYSPVPASQPPASQAPPAHQPPDTHSSPFDTVFDDHVYPANPQPNHGASNSDVSQQGLYQDTTYYGSARPNGHDDIPLQDRPGKDVEMNDHIYDAPAGASGSKKKKKRGKVQLGELGMLGADKKRIPWVVYIFSIAQIGVFIGMIVRNATLTGTPIQIKPSFNPMIGPSSSVMINMGGRFTPCMRNLEEIQGTAAGQRPNFLCPNGTKNEDICDLKTLCGFGGSVPNPGAKDINQKPEPNQWYRFIIPMFMHAGLIHIGFNLLLQLTIAKEMEMAIGSIRFFLVYVSAGIFGFVMSGNYATPGIVSTGASGSLFGIIGLTLLDLLYSWKDRRSPIKDLMFIAADVIIAFVLGLLPGLDNFCHIGGFIMGVALGVAVLHSPNSLRKRIGHQQTYSAVSDDLNATPPAFLKSPVGFFKGRKPLWWAWWLVRAGMVVAIVAVFIVLINNFYNHYGDCKWCKHLSCIDVKGWCELGQL